MKKLDLLGQKFNRLFVIEYVESKARHTYWKCVCDCGKQVIVKGYTLKNNSTKSCGCLRGDVSRQTIKNAHLAKTLPCGVSNFNSIYSRYKQQAADRNLLFEITKEDFYSIVIRNCHYCGIAPSQTSKSNARENLGIFLYNGIDRLDNNQGYMLDNCVPCCKICNRAKRDMSYDDFMMWILRIIKHNTTSEQI